VRGPGYDIDSPFTEIKLPNGRFRGFTAAGITFAIDGDQSWDMGGSEVAVLNRGVANGPASCGQWIQHVEPAGNLLLGWVHSETACDYSKAQTHKSVAFATSADNGLTWKVEGPIISGVSAPTPGKTTGEGDCTALDGKDGYYYAYCWQTRSGLPGSTGGVSVSRAPTSNPGPKNWRKYFNGAWSQPGIGGEATKLEVGGGTSCARWLTTGETVIVGNLPGGGYGLFFSQDHINFTPMHEPLLVGDPATWSRPADPYELMAYWSLLDANIGTNQLSNHWNLVYMDIQPHEGFSRRYLVFRPIEVSRSPQPAAPQVGIMLGHWYNSRLHDHWSTTGSVPGNYTDYKLASESGYLMTIADPKSPSVELEDCVNLQGEHSDHMLSPKGACEIQGFKRLRPAGWVYSAPHPGTQPLYSCHSEAEKSHFVALQPNCDGLGKMEALLGYDLKQ
jgi:hypothetical protein